MTALNYQADQYLRQAGKIVDLGEYRRLLEPCPAGLPPLPRRSRERGLVLRPEDLFSLCMAGATVALTGALLALL